MASARHAGPERQLDDCDLQLINQLQIDGRLALGDLAETLGVHRNTAKARLDRLLKSRVLIPRCILILSIWGTWRRLR